MLSKLNEYKDAILLSKEFEIIGFKDEQQFDTHNYRLGCLLNITGQYELALEVLKAIKLPNQKVVIEMDKASIKLEKGHAKQKRFAQSP